MGRPAKPITTNSGRVKLRRKKLKEGGESVYLDTYTDGKRSYEFLGLRLTGDKVSDKEILRVAEMKRSQREVELATGGTGVVPAHSRHGSFLDFFSELAEAKGHPAWNGAHGHLLASSGGVLSFGALTEKWAESFRRYLLEEAGLSQNSCALYWQKVRCALKEALRRGKIAADPSRDVESIRMESTERVFLSIDEVRSLNETPCSNEEVKRAFLFSCFTGLRVSDLYRLTWENIRGDSITLRVQKTNVVETFPLGASAQRLLSDATDDQSSVPDDTATESERVFKLPPKRTADLVLLRWAIAAGIRKPITFHTGRHSCAMFLVGGGADIYAVSKILGHKSIKSTMVYAKIQDEQKRTAVDKLPTL